MIPLTSPKSDHAEPGLSSLDDHSIGITFEQLLAETGRNWLEQELSRLDVELGTIRSQSSALQSALSGSS
jgi:hypothetical protein